LKGTWAVPVRESVADAVGVPELVGVAVQEMEPVGEIERVAVGEMVGDSVKEAEEEGVWVRDGRGVALGDGVPLMVSVEETVAEIEPRTPHIK
jgi:hypothetical protein